MHKPRAYTYTAIHMFHMLWYKPWFNCYIQPAHIYNIWLYELCNGTMGRGLSPGPRPFPYNTKCKHKYMFYDIANKE